MDIINIFNYFPEFIKKINNEIEVVKIEKIEGDDL